MFLDINRMDEGEVSLDGVLELEGLRDAVGAPIPTAPIRLLGRAARTEGSVVLVARIEGSLRLACARCAQSFDLPLEVAFDLTLVPSAVDFSTGDAQITKRDTGLFYASPDGSVDLRTVASEQIHLHLPLKPVCRAGCRGLCTVCGVDLNRSTCDCAAQAVDPRLAPLARLRRND